MGMFARWDAALPSIAITDHGHTTSTGSPLTLGASLNIGTARNDRLVIVALGFDLSLQSGTLPTPGLTINGNAAALLRYAQVSGSESTGVALFALSVPSGTTANIVASISTGFKTAGTSFGVWAAYGLISQTPNATASDTILPVNMSIATQANGIVVAAAATGITGTAATWTWSAGITEDFDEGVANIGCSGASAITPTTTTLALAPVAAPNSGFGVGVAAAFR